MAPLMDTAGSVVKGAILLLTTLSFICPATLTKRSLSESILYYEALNYDPSQVRSDHTRITRRSVPDNQYSTANTREQDYIKLKFHAHDRDFNLQMTPDVNIFTKDFVVETDKGRVEFDKSRVYNGHVTGVPGSTVSGILLKDGRFEGKILMEGEEFFIEKADKYLTELPTQENFHSVIYKMSDVDLSAVQNTSGCKSDELREAMRDVMRNIQVPPAPDDNLDPLHDDGPLNSPYRKEGMYNPVRTRTRREVDPDKTMCELYLQADHLYYEKWGSSVDTVIEQLTAHVEAVNDIYKITDFDDDSSPDNIRFVIKRLKIWTDPTASDYPFGGNMDVRTFLETFSAQDNFDSFCLAYTFTHRDFNDGTLGLAWTASLDAAGGVCTKNGLFNGQMMSLNTGIVTTLNFQRDVAFAISQLTMSHELGHNLGSSHDDESDSTCSPGSSNGGNYIMFPKATDGDKSNNNKFSPCSISLINEIMNAIARSTADSSCFKQWSSTVCGNKIVESGEHCDCGWEDECTESCCNPQKDTYDPQTYTPCTYTNSATCSPSEGACCDSSCSPRPSSADFVCRSNTSCLSSAYCDGTNTCPSSSSIADGADCDNDMVCLNGECTNAICQAFGYVSCQCDPDVEHDWSDEKLCKLCCLDGSACKPAADIPSITKTTTSGTGQPCYDYQGYCDVFNKCRKLDPVGTLNALKDMLFSAEGLATVTEWLESNWYIPAAAGVGFIIMMVLIVRFGGKHEPVTPPDMSNKNTTLPHSKQRNKVSPTSPPPAYSQYNKRPPNKGW